ncbi:A/G-specific adenine glycosylase [Salinibacter ruber]|uniref:hypothetical protein n=1 Tax=Salinibacter ruber TaxID=146919 RepID=UPI00216A3D6E|nr:hypothetical protein [Salinibacter ruber]MCS3627179.1 A/G-specific adenine glycosylase [Salinibacter ruber]MCS4144086.1 A/G-specific adenine glycosylase [Salinibacter ruber]
MADKKPADLIPVGFFVSWYKENGRDFPWRKEEVSTFQLLLTEMLLRQTQAVQVEGIWTNFMDRYGTPGLIEDADREDLFESVQELGFGNQRTKALKAATRYILAEHDGSVPPRKEHLLDVPHIGPYSAQAIQCFAFGKRVPIVDTNILRFFCRLTGRQVKRPDIRRVDWVWEQARSVLPERSEDTIDHNYGLLDFTAEVCVAPKPDCNECTLSQECSYGWNVLHGRKPTEAW